MPRSNYVSFTRDGFLDMASAIQDGEDPLAVWNRNLERQLVPAEPVMRAIQRALHEDKHLSLGSLERETGFNARRAWRTKQRFMQAGTAIAIATFIGADPVEVGV